jgi:hypothetical protein
METAQDTTSREPAVTAVTRSLLGDAARQRYMKALNELVGVLAIDTFEKVDVDNFLLRYELKPSFFDALRDLDGLEMNMVATEPNWFRKTKKLYQLTPEQILLQMRANAHKTHKSKQEITDTDPKIEPLSSAPLPAAVIEIQKKVEEARKVPKETVIPDWVIDTLTEQSDKVVTSDAINPPIEPPISPYVVRIESKKMDLRLDVQTRQDAAMITAIMAELNI